MGVLHHLPVLVVGGAPEAGRHTLMGRLLGFEGEKRAHPLPTVTATACADVWRIETKYYAADVRVCCAETPADVALDGAACEGVILVFDATQPASFQHLSCWETFLAAHDLGVAVCAGNKSDLAGARAIDAGREGWANWALDHQLEFCACSALTDVFTGDRETAGVERVAEALGSHAWSGYTRTDGGARLSAAAGTASDSAFDTSRWDRFVAEEERQAEPDPEALALERSRMRVEPARADGEIAIDDDVAALVENAQLDADEVKVIQELLEATQHPEFDAGTFFRDPAALLSASAGPNAQLHLTLEHALPSVAKILQELVLIYREQPAASRLLVRSTIWSNMVDAAQPGATAAGGTGGVAAVPVLVPLALVWAVLESCAAETPGKFFARVSASRAALGAFVEEAMAPAVVRALQPGARRADYVQQLLEAAASEKEAGNACFQRARADPAQVYFAVKHYAAALKIVEQFWVRGRLCVDGAQTLAVACHLNYAACRLKDGREGSAEEAALHCNMALALAPDNAKAYFRRGLAMLASRSCDALPPNPPPVIEPPRPAGGGGGGGGGELNSEDMIAAARVALAAKRAETLDTKKEREGLETDDEVLTPEQQEQKLRKETAHLPPRNVLVCWAVRDLDRASELAPGDTAVAAALRDARQEATLLARDALTSCEGDLTREDRRAAEVMAAGQRTLDSAEEASDEEEGGEGGAEDIGKLMQMLQTARQDAHTLPDDERRERAAALAAKAAKVMGVDDED